MRRIVTLLTTVAVLGILTAAADRPAGSITWPKRVDLTTVAPPAAPATPAEALERADWFARQQRLVAEQAWNLLPPGEVLIAPADGGGWVVLLEAEDEWSQSLLVLDATGSLQAIVKHVGDAALHRMATPQRRAVGSHRTALAKVRLVLESEYCREAVLPNTFAAARSGPAERTDEGGWSFTMIEQRGATGANGVELVLDAHGGLVGIWRWSASSARAISPPEPPVPEGAN